MKGEEMHGFAPRARTGKAVRGLGVTVTVGLEVISGNEGRGGGSAEDEDG